MKVIPYEAGWFEQVVQFLKENWAPRHALFERKLFDWQYYAHNQQNSLILIEGNAVRGFLGVIPAQYSLVGEMVTGIGLALWCVAKELRQGGLGIVLLREAVKQNRVVLTLGVNANVVSMYQRMGYNVMPRLWRWVSILERKGFENLLTAPRSRNFSSAHFSTVTQGHALPPTPSPDQLAELYKTAVRPNYLFTQHRDADFWHWQYFSSPGFRYEFFGDTQNQGAVVARVERVYAPDRPEVDKLKVLRLIELIPASHTGAIELLNGVLAWGLQRGCCAADFQCSNRRLEPILQACGFHEQGAGEPYSLFAQLFQPLRDNVPPINFAYKTVDAEGRSIFIDPEQTYFVKSDCNMDRPNIMPVPL